MFADRLCGVDLDHSRDPETGDIEPWAQEAVIALNSYTEASPSGAGLHVLVLGELPPGGRRKGNVEIYGPGSPRYFTVSGRHLEGTPGTVEERSAELAAFHALVFAEQPQSLSERTTVRNSPNLADAELLEAAFRAANGPAIKALFDAPGADGNSEGDAALCGHLAFYAGGDPGLLERLVRASNRVRPKWDGKRGAETWIGAECRKAMARHSGEFYTPGAGEQGRADAMARGHGVAEEGAEGGRESPPDPEGTAHDRDGRATGRRDAAPTGEGDDWEPPQRGREPWDYGAFCARLADPDATVDTVWREVPQIATLAAAQVAQVKARARDRFGLLLPARDFDKAIAEEQRKWRRRRLRTDEGRPAITCGRQLREVVNEALHELHQANDPPVVFVRAGELVRLEIDEMGRPSIGRFGVDSLRHRCAEIANWIRNNKEGESDCSPPEDVVRTVLVHGEWTFPPLEALVEHPVVRPDGQIADVPGYDPVTRLLYVTNGQLTVPPIPEEPTPDDLQRALDTVLQCIAEFPFVDAAGLPNTIGMFLTPMVRPAIAGCVPLACITAPAAGTGKGLLREIMAIIATGKAASMFQAPSTPEEWQKSILAKLVAGKMIISIDNIEGMLRDPTLCMTLTGEFVEGRVLGLTKDVVMSHRAIWTATGNNLKVGGDLPRRCYWVRLDPQTNEPEAREFAIPNLKRHVFEHRGEIICALLTMVRAWYAAGCPEPPQDGVTQIMGSFEDWQRVVGGILHVAGVTGFMSNQREMRELSDTDMPMWRAFLETWASLIHEPVTGKALIAACGEHEELREAVPDWLFDRGGEINVRKLGNGLAAREGRHFNGEGLRIQRVGTAQRRVKWLVMTGEQASELRMLTQDNSQETHPFNGGPSEAV
jgi:hypothetical protein